MILSEVIYLDSVDSTSDWLKRNFKNLVPDETVVWAGTQTAGRGQYDRVWLSQTGGLFFSVLLFPDFSKITPQELLVSFANHFISEAERRWGISLWLKQPNDVYFEDKKLMGILTENSFLGNEMEYCIMGVGLNVNQSFENLDPGFQATSLHDILSKPLELEPLLISLLESWDLESIKN
jgi:BirA family biotin operon repressor/biotin-[acetyl-CoA-carboxylase] ligase